jgi:hypothetical protein
MGSLKIKLGEQNIFETAQGIAIVSKSLSQAGCKRPYYFIRLLYFRKRSILKSK